MTMLADPPQPYALPPRRGTNWSEVLEPGERLLWQGRPCGRLRIRWRDLPLIVVGAVIVVLAVMLGAEAAAGLRASEEMATRMLILALVVAGFGLWCVIGPPIMDMLRRRGTSYALTDRRALVETDFMGRGLAAWPITEDSPLWLEPGNPPTACFGMLRPRPRLSDRLRGKLATRVRAAGFERVPEAERVLALMRGIQKGAA